ncbi:hypothetical protein Kalk_08585 [Ketobacter alkanivorans]|uniref:Bacteriophage lambda Replication protein O N-terminal domain-containing protein n=1 Tax=Ketobacter alkanivorans TaxID=1917421 RepID=A0A2K9LVI2_9GAMM|nr:hypothetical protein Kalk_08585 [Ketobacter alkanivorans]
MARNRAKTKGRGGTPPFFQLTHRLLDLPAYIQLPHTAKSLLIDMARQYNGHNNGDICVTLKVMKKRGWTSNGTMWRALQALIAADLVMQTRQGGLNKCSLYAFTWLAINECGGKLDIAPTKGPPIPLHMHPSLNK